MGCGGNSSRAVELPKNLTFHGNILDNQTRSLIGCCQLSSQAYILNKVDHLKGEHKQPKYAAINPTGHIPMAEEGPYKIMGGNHIIFIYLCKSKPAIGQKLLPVELEQKIKGILGWH